MRYITTIMLFLFATYAYAQDSCNCGTVLKAVTYPRIAEQNKISGTVIIEWKVSVEGIWSNPIIVKSLGYGCDEEAMKAVRSMINMNNFCRQKCKIKDGKTGKLTQTFNFRYVDE